MKINNSTKYSALFFLIFLLGLIFFVATIHKSLNKQSDALIKSDNDQSKEITFHLRDRK